MPELSLHKALWHRYNHMACSSQHTVTQIKYLKCSCPEKRPDHRLDKTGNRTRTSHITRQPASHCAITCVDIPIYIYTRKYNK